jgi:hypothetical protein
VPPLPGWVVAASAETGAAAAFRSGAALAHLALVARVDDLPLALWRDRLALAAAEGCVALAGRREGQGALRDAVHLTRPGDDPGPAGRIFRQWSQAVARPVSVAGLVRVLEGMTAERIALCLDSGGPDVSGQTPVDRAAKVVEAMLTDAPRAEEAALILGDTVLSQALGLGQVVPLLALGLKARDLRLRGDGLRLACHRAVVTGVAQAVALAADLVRRAARLRAVAPKLRAKAAGQAVDLFLSRDALAPGALGFMSDRAARRLCDRLVGLGVLRELTGRDTFRLYGV